MNAIIFGFDVKCPQAIAKRTEAAGVPVKLHKIIYKFNEDMENLVHDVKMKDL